MNLAVLLDSKQPNYVVKISSSSFVSILLCFFLSQKIDSYAASFPEKEKVIPCKKYMQFQARIKDRDKQFIH